MKALCPIEITCDELIKDTCVNDEHPIKAYSSIVSTDEGIMTCTNDEQPLRLFSLIVEH